jgi:hypothetical protein
MDHKKRSIIVEGADASGKSTLATKLGEHYGIYTFRAGPKPVDSEHSEICMIYQCAWLRKTSCVWDRFTGISNICNLPAIHNKDIPMHGHYANLAMEHAAIVICTGQNLDGHRQESYESDEDLDRMIMETAQVSDNYKRLAHDLPNVIRYDFKVRSYESLLEELDYAVSIRL